MHDQSNVIRNRWEVPYFKNVSYYGNKVIIISPGPFIFVFFLLDASVKSKATFALQIRGA